MSSGVPGKNLVNQKINSTKRGRTNAAGLSIPIRFFVDATGFEVKVKSSASNKILNLDPPPVPGFFDLYLCMRADDVPALVPPQLFKRGPAIAAVSLPETMLDERRLEAVLKMARKKRC